MILSEELTSWRIDRPDEWKMDEFIQKAKQLEEALATLPLKTQGEPIAWLYRDYGELRVCQYSPSPADSFPVFTSAPTVTSSPEVNEV